MYITGNSFRTTPEVSSMRLTFSNLTFFKTGIARIGISGEGNSGISFTFSGNRIFDPNKCFLGTYTSGVPFNLDWVITSNNYYFSINNKIIKKNNPKTNFYIQKFFVNTTGLEVYADTSLYCPNIPYNISFNENYNALSSITGYISNSSDFHFRVFQSSLVFYNTLGNPLTGAITGIVPSQGSLTLKFNDTSTSRFDSSVQYLALFDTSIGQISGIFTANRVSGLSKVISSIDTSQSGIYLEALFDGSGSPANTFTYTQTASSYLISYLVNSSDLNGVNKPKTITVSLESSYPLNNSQYISEYPTGFTLTNNGEYLYIPKLNITGYYHVTGLNWPLESILLSSGCSGNVTVTFTGSNGVGASGYIKSTKARLSGIYSEGLNYYYLPQSFTMVSGGTGYLSIPKANLITGEYLNCYDVGSKYNSQYLMFKPFSGSGNIDIQAGYLTGEVLTQTGIVNSNQTGYIVTGIEFTNPGSGYTSGLFPKASFERQNGDNLTNDASGVFSMKYTGLYIFSDSWFLSTGISSSDLKEMNGLSGTGYLNANDNYLTIQVNYTGLDNTQPVVAKLTINMSGANTITHYITGTKTYDLSTGYLKKKNTLLLTKFSSEAGLGFDLTQSDLDEYYSSDEYINNGNQISLGDLDF